MTPADWMAHHRQQQGLPPTITDPVVLARLATLVRSARQRQSDVPASPPD